MDAFSLKAVAHYNDSKSSTATARHFGIGRKRVTCIVKEAGAYVPRAVTLTKARQKELIKRFKAGVSQMQLARDFELSQTWVGRFLRAEGIITEPIRPSGENHGSWKGGRTVDGNGYARVIMPKDHRFASMRLCDGYVLEHRLVMAEHLGRALTPST